MHKVYMLENGLKPQIQFWKNRNNYILFARDRSVPNSLQNKYTLSKLINNLLIYLRVEECLIGLSQLLIDDLSTFW